jgi:hypothetical protein
MKIKMHSFVHNSTKYLSEQKLFWTYIVDRNETHFMILNSH